jgi:RNA polymerase sigma factor (sigma-70 family)
MDDEVDFPITELVVAAAGGNAGAWAQIVTRYRPLLITVVRQFGLTPAEIDDVAQTVWLRLVEHLDALREPRALPMWIITTGRREALRYLAVERRSQPHDPSRLSLPEVDRQAAPLDEELMRAERHQALLAGMAELGTRHRQLLLLLIEDPPLPYTEISRRTGIPVGSIGPTRARAVERLRRTPSIRAWMAAEADGRSAARMKG